MTATLTKLSLENFQSLKKTELELDPGLNVLVGPSNLGKSAAIRALRALVRNAAAPGLIREGATTMVVSAEFSDGSRESLTKGKNKSEFRFTLPDAEEIVHAKSGATEVPTEVVDLWKIPRPDGREIAFATQHEPPFLLAEPASAVAKVLGDLTNASMLMEAVSKCNKLRTGSLNDVKARTREATEAKEEILTHAGLTARGKNLEAARQAYSKAETAIQRYQTLVALQDKRTNLIEQQQALMLDTEKITILTELVRLVDDSAAQFTMLFDLNECYENLNIQAALAQDDVWQTEEQISIREEQIQKLLDEAGICPLCNQEIT